MMLLVGRKDAEAFLLVILNAFLVIPWIGVSGSVVKDTSKVYIAAACYGTVNNYLRLHCIDDTVIKVIKVIQGAKLKVKNCTTPATSTTYNKSCCRPNASDCKIEVHDNVSGTCNGNTQCEFMAMWSTVSSQCDQDLYPFTITYMQTDYICIQSAFSPTTTEGPTTANHTSVPRTPRMPLTTDRVGSVGTSRTSRPVVVVSTHEEDTGDSSIEMSDSIIGAIIAGSVGMLLTFLVFVVYWRRKRRLRIIGKPQTSVWDYLLNQTFTVRGERGYDHFSSCRSSASSDNGEPKSPVFRKTLWLPNISPVDDTQSNVFNDNDTVHNLEFHQVGTPNPYAFLSLGVNDTNDTNNSNNSNSNISNISTITSNNNTPNDSNSIAEHSAQSQHDA